MSVADFTITLDTQIYSGDGPHTLAISYLDEIDADDLTCEISNREGTVVTTHSLDSCQVACEYDEYFV